MPKGVYQRTPENTRGPRQYPSHIVELVAALYVDQGFTVREVQAALPQGFKAQRIIERHIPKRRPAGPRDQSGPANPLWKGDAAGYQALHLRVQMARGKPQRCERCGTTEGRMEWANLTGDYVDVNDYERMCVSCHRTFDAARRRLTGRRTAPTRR